MRFKEIYQNNNEIRNLEIVIKKIVEVTRFFIYTYETVEKESKKSKHKNKSAPQYRITASNLGPLGCSIKKAYKIFNVTVNKFKIFNCNR